MSWTPPEALPAGSSRVAAPPVAPVASVAEAATVGGARAPCGRRARPVHGATALAPVDVTAPVVVPFGPILRVPDDASPSVPSAAAGTQHADAAVAQRMQQPVHELIPAKLRNDGALGQRCRALSDGETGRHWAFDDDWTGDGGRVRGRAGPGGVQFGLAADVGGRALTIRVVRSSPAARDKVGDWAVRPVALGVGVDSRCTSSVISFQNSTKRSAKSRR